MIVLINGSFGVGKTTVANLLRDGLPKSAIYDPEWAGIGLMRLPGWIKLKGAGTDDFQDIALWRKSVIMGTRLFRFLVSGAVIIPMTFSDRTHYDEVVEGLRELDRELRVFCLTASLPTVRKRVAGRGTNSDSEREWIARRIVECAEAHCDPHFGEPVDTEGRTSREVAEEIIRRLQRPGRRPDG